jgi:hypothetical protein
LALAAMGLIKGMRLFVYCFLVFCFLACSPAETARVLGFGVKPFKNNGKMHTQTIDQDFFTTYKQIETILREMSATIYRSSSKKGYIVANNFHTSFQDRCLSSTEVGIFLSEDGLDKTQVEISSLNFSLSDFVAEKIFTELKK